MKSEKSIYFQIPKIEKEGFVVQFDNLDFFYDQLHHHPELQLIFILKGTGDLFIGDSITTFEPGDLFLFGSNQSHLLKSDSMYFEKDCPEMSCSISIFFHEESLGKGFFDITETTVIKNLIDRTSHSMQFAPEVAGRIGDRIKKLADMSGFDRFLEILSILNTLGQTEEYKPLAVVSTTNPPTDQESERINIVVNYILQHYKEDIELGTIAEIANYSKAAFCRFFKQRTRKTFTQFLNEVRIAQACKLLRNTDLNISQVCFESGYNNVSNFNRQFKRITETTPKDYVDKFKKLSSSPHIIEHNS